MRRKVRRRSGETRAGAAGSDFARAQSLEASGDLAGAANIYRGIVEGQPRHTRALHRLGLLYARSGDLDTAREWFHRAVEARPSFAPARADLGKTLLLLGQPEAAEAQCRAALRLDRGDSSTLVTLAASLIALGRAEDAERHVRRAVSQLPESAEAQTVLGNALVLRGDLDGAAAAYRTALRIRPDFAEAHANLGSLLVRLGDPKAAVVSLRRAEQLQPTNPETSNALGNALAAAGEADAALKAFARAQQLSPTWALPHFNAANLLAETGRREEAITGYRRALALDEDFKAAHNNLADLLADAGDLEGAERHYRRALAIDPDDVDTQANLANCFEQASRLDQARDEAELGLQKRPDHPLLRLVMARVLRRQGDLEAAHDCLAAFEPASGTSLHLRQARHFELGQICDLAGKSEAAFGHFAQGNALASEFFGSVDRSRNRIVRLIETMKTGVTVDTVADWRPTTTAPPEETPIFLVGFPRSGTTLLHHVFESHPSLQVMEEVEALDAAARFLEARTADYPASLGQLTPDMLTEARRVYWQAAEAAVSRRGGCRLVDKLPLNLLRLAEIRQLFPGAPIIFALRHPCDVCLSAFMQNFAVNDAMAFFFSLEDTAWLYDAVMGLQSQLREVFGDLAVHELRYEDLVEDFDPTVEALLQHLGLPWDAAVRDFAETARRRGRINTPSYTQVTQGLYRKARYRWLRYAEQMAPVLPILRPWITAFGYSEAAHEDASTA